MKPFRFRDETIFTQTCLRSANTRNKQGRLATATTTPAMNPLTQQKIRIRSILVMVSKEKPRQGRAGAQSQAGKKSSPTEEGARRLRAIRQLCFSPIA